MKMFLCVFFLQILVCVHPKIRNPGRIGEGEELTDSTKFPFYAMLYIPVYPNPETVIICGGALIHNGWILTAGHCFPDDIKIFTWIGNSNVPMVFMGSIKRLHLEYNPESSRSIIEIRRHPGYKIESSNINGIQRDLMWNDIALIKLKQPYKMSYTIQTVKLATTFGLCKYCTLIGMGDTNVTNVNSLSGTTKYAKALIKDYKDLSHQTGHVTGTTFFTEIKIGGIYASSGYALQGDSGGPAICEIDDGKTQILIGVISALSPDRQYTIVINVMERVDLYINFIKEYVPEQKLRRKRRIKHRSDASCKEIKLLLLCLMIAFCICTV